VTTGHANVNEPTRERVRAAMRQVGGYWRPLAAVARLQEELGELAELLMTCTPDIEQHAADLAERWPSELAEQCASELADLWIISTALADQFLGAVADRSPRVTCWAASSPRLGGSRESSTTTTDQRHHARWRAGSR
jgi:NTP pyrophosphatase (non-canonical NTP hydrolase)